MPLSVIKPPSTVEIELPNGMNVVVTDPVNPTNAPRNMTTTEAAELLVLLTDNKAAL